MWRFWGVHHGISYESFVFSQRSVCIPIKIQVTSGTPWDITRKCCITILYIAVANVMADSINAVHDGKVGWLSSRIQRLSRVLIGSVFFRRGINTGDLHLYFDSFLQDNGSWFLLVCTSFVSRARDIVWVVWLLFAGPNYLVNGRGGPYK